jgi:antitoxin HicB
MKADKNYLFAFIRVICSSKFLLWLGAPPNRSISNASSGLSTLSEVAMNDIEYRFTIRPLTQKEGGGYLIEFPDLPGCMSDGETIDEALANGAEAKRDWIAAMQAAGRPVPAPTAEAAEAYSDKWVLRTPKSLHRGLAERARQEGVSLNALAVAMLAQGLGQRLPRSEGTGW